MKVIRIAHALLSAVMIILWMMIIGDTTKFVIEYGVPLSSIVALYSMEIGLCAFCLFGVFWNWDE